jgi:serine/threonine protein phosphatase PrpC
MISGSWRSSRREGPGLEVVCEELVAQTNAQAGRDNISAVLVDTTLSA